MGHLSKVAQGVSPPSPSKKTQNNQEGQVKAPGNKPNILSSIPRIHKREERADSYKLSSALQSWTPGGETDAAAASRLSHSAV